MDRHPLSSKVTKEAQGCTHLSCNRSCQHKQSALYPSHVTAVTSRFCHLFTQVSNSEQNTRNAQGREIEQGRQERGIMTVLCVFSKLC